MRARDLIAIMTCGAIGFTGLYAQAATVSGQIRSAEDRPVDKAIVQVGNKFDITDVDGKFRIKEVPQGRQPMQIRKDGRVLKETEIDVNETDINKNEKLPPE